MTPALPMSTDMRLVVEVLTRGDEHTPRLACVYSQSPEPHECYARMHALTALVWAASKGKGWDVRPVHGYDAHGQVYAGAELALDRATYQAAREGERVLEAVAAGIA